MIFSSPGYIYNESNFMKIRNFKEVDSVKISILENLGTLDGTQLLKAIYKGFDAIFVIIKGKIKGNKFISEYESFHKPLKEVNRILKRRGLGNQRLKLFKFDGRNQTKLDDDLCNFFRNLIHSGPNPINTGIRKMRMTSDYNYNFESISIKKLMYATYKASYNFQYRTLFKAKEKILKSKRYDENEINYLLDSIFDAETARKYMLEELKRNKPLPIEEIINLFDLTEENIIRDLFYLKEQGNIEEIFEEVPVNKLNHTKSLKSKEYFYKYRAKEKKEIFWKNYFKSVSIIHDNNVCCRCGLCSSVCPVECIELTKDYLFIDEAKCTTCGLCFSVCPQSFSIESMYKFICKYDNSLKYSEALGYYKNIYSARTLKYGIRIVGQDGGIVTSLLYYLLNKNLVDAVITIIHSKKSWEPKVCVIEKAEELYKTAGTTYAYSPVLSVLDKTKKYKKLAIVALPCKMKALLKGELFPVKLPLLNNIKYKIGLFCKRSFPYEEMLSLFNDKFSVNIDEIVKMDINQGRFVITIESGEIFSLPLKECDSYGCDFCNYCNDYTSELADVSIGSVGSEAGWSSVITRTMKGEQIFNDIVNDGFIEIKDFIDKKPIQLKIEKMAEIKRISCIPIELDLI